MTFRWAVTVKNISGRKWAEEGEAADPSAAMRAATHALDRLADNLAGTFRDSTVKIQKSTGLRESASSPKTPV